MGGSVNYKKIILMILMFGFLGCSEKNVSSTNLNANERLLKLDLDKNQSSKIEVKKGTYLGHSIEYNEVDGIKYFGGDILLNKDANFVDQESLSNQVSEKGLHKTHICAGLHKNICVVDSRWPRRTIPYVISPNFRFETRQYLKASLDEMNSLTVLNFVPRTNEIDYIFIEPIDKTRFPNAAGLTYIGYQRSGAQSVMVVDYPVYWFLKSVIQHEMLHAIGMAHEQNRPDRNLYIDLFDENIIPEVRSNFLPFNFYSKSYGPYDPYSIMHYGSDSGSNGRGPSMLLKNGTRIPYNSVMTYWDITTIYYMYITRPL